MDVILHKNINVMEENYIPSHTEEDDDRDYCVISYKGRNVYTEDSAFLNRDYKWVKDEDDNNFLEEN